MTRKDLHAHVSEAHRGAKHAVVCPICAAGSGGDPNRQSSDFVGHMKLRHAYDLDDYVAHEQVRSHSHFCARSFAVRMRSSRATEPGSGVAVF